MTLKERFWMIRNGVLVAIGLILLINAACLFFVRQSRFRFIVIHHSASRVDNYRSIRAYQTRDHDWIDAAYHLILSNGSTEVPEGHLEATGRWSTMDFSPATRSGKHNVFGVHVCVVGNYDEEETSDLVRASLAGVIGRLQESFQIPTSRILLHRECSPSQCPGRNITREGIRQWLVEGSGGLPEEIRVQHEEVLGPTGLVQPEIPLFFHQMLSLNLWSLGFLLSILLLRAFVSRRARRTDLVS